MELFNIPITVPSLVKDTLGGKFYGEDSYSYYAATTKAAIEHYSKIIDQAKTKNGIGLQTIDRTDTSFFEGKQLTLAEDAAKNLASIQTASSGVTESNYIQHPGITASYGTYKSGWDNYFESTYKNPRQEEANQFAINPLTASQGGNSPVSIPTKNLVAKTVGTGIAGTSSINPFGTLDSGLGI